MRCRQRRMVCQQTLCAFATTPSPTTGYEYDWVMERRRSAESNRKRKIYRAANTPGEMSSTIPALRSLHAPPCFGGAKLPRPLLSKTVHVTANHASYPESPSPFLHPEQCFHVAKNPMKSSMATDRSGVLPVIGSGLLLACHR